MATMIEIPKNQHKYSTGVLLLGPGNIEEYLKKVSQVSKFPIISVGSGNGVVEREIETSLGIQILCVDPTPLSWSMSTEPDECHMPDFPTITDLARERPELIGKCNIFINWAYPTHVYDMEALLVMQPMNVVTVLDVGPLRGAGGRAFHTWMYKCGVATCGTLDDNSADMAAVDAYPTSNYVFRTWTNYLSPSGNVEISIIWLSRDICNTRADSRSTEIANSPLSIAVFQAAARANAVAALQPISQLCRKSSKIPDCSF
jgi:hypothetical protein